MINLSFRYDQNSTRLIVDGLPDISQGQDSNKLGILSSWKLQILGFPELEGKKDHLQNLIGVLYPYTQHYLAGSPRSFGDNSASVSIYNFDHKHKLILRSSQKDIKPLEILLDDAEICDLVYCLDMLINDDRILLELKIPTIKPLPQKLSSLLYFNFNNILPPFIAGSLLIMFSSLFLLIPIPIEFDNNEYGKIETEYNNTYK
tara:strand:+ start:296 stop:904 length:609 start_codon:yes stop_codon:yes gene_type:complete